MNEVINKEVMKLLLERTKVSPRSIYRMIMERKALHSYTITNQTAA